VFTPEKTLQAEALVRGSWDGPVFEGPVAVTIMFSTTEIHITVEEMLDVSSSKLRGDVDNYVKTVMDGLNGAAWADDKQVHHIEATKS
jgi:Holliday junction resolvase RusA-like endonuclease